VPAVVMLPVASVSSRARGRGMGVSELGRRSAPPAPLLSRKGSALILPLYGKVGADRICKDMAC
jgi:hypothetical protein